MQVKRARDFLTSEMKDKYTEGTIPLLPDRLEEDHATFYALVGGIRLPVEFNLQNNKVELIYERCRFEKTDRLLANKKASYRVIYTVA